MIREVVMFRIECDADGCDESPQDGSDVYAWLQRDVALDEAHSACWYVGDFGDLCLTHAPRCPCGALVDDDDLDGLCVDCDEHAQRVLAAADV